MNVISLNVERLSTSEDVILNLTIKTACNKLSPWGRSSLFIVDETVDCIDAQRWETALPELLDILKTNYLNILLISHKPIDRCYVDQSIKIENHNTYSRLV